MYGQGVLDKFRLRVLIFIAIILWKSKLESKRTWNPSGHSSSCWHLSAVSIFLVLGRWNYGVMTMKRVSHCFSFLRCPVPGAGAGFGPRTIEDPLPHLLSPDSPSETVLTAGTGSSAPGERTESSEVLWVCAKHSVQPTSPKITLHLQRHIREPVLPADQLHDMWGHSHVLLCYTQWGEVSVNPDTHLPESGQGGLQGALRTSQTVLNVIRECWGSPGKPANKFQNRCRGRYGGVFSQKLWILHWIIIIIALTGSLIHNDSREHSYLWTWDFFIHGVRYVFVFPSILEPAAQKFFFIATCF